MSSIERSSSFSAVGQPFVSEDIKTDQTKGVAKPQPLDIPHHLSLEQQKQLKNEVQTAIKETNTSFKEISDNAWGPLFNVNKSNDPGRIALSKALNEKVDAFKEKHKDSIKLMQGKNWKETIADLNNKKDFAQIEKLEKFRLEQIELQGKLTSMAAEAMGMPPGSWKYFGTPGARSDVDNSLTNQGASEHSQMFIKTLADTVFMHLFDGLSGTQADLESYLTHFGRTYNLGSEKSGLLLTEEGRKQFNLLELMGAYIGEYRNLKKDPQGWDNYKEEQYKLHQGSREVLEAAFKDIETLEGDADKKIAAQMQKEGQALRDKGKPIPSDLEKRAAMTCRTQPLLELSESMDVRQKKLDTLRNEIHSGKSTPKKQEECDRLQISLAVSAAVRYSMFDETYITQGAYLSACESEQRGQIGQRVEEATAKADEMSIKLGKRASISGKEERAKISDKPIQPVTHQQQLISARENASRVKEKLTAYQEKAKKSEKPDEEMQHFAINSGKYTERTAGDTRASLITVRDKLKTEKEELEQLKQKASTGSEGDKKLWNSSTEARLMKVNGLLARAEASSATAEQIHKKTIELESCLRKFVIPGAVTKSHIKEAIGKEAVEKIKGDLLTNKQAANEREAQEKAVKEFDKLVTEMDTTLTSKRSKVQKYNKALLILDSVLPLKHKDAEQVQAVTEKLNATLMNKLFEGHAIPSPKSQPKLSTSEMAEVVDVQNKIIKKGSQAVKEFFLQLSHAHKMVLINSAKMEKSDKPFDDIVIANIQNTLKLEEPHVTVFNSLTEGQKICLIQSATERIELNKWNKSVEDVVKEIIEEGLRNAKGETTKIRARTISGGSSTDMVAQQTLKKVDENKEGMAHKVTLPASPGSERRHSIAQRRLSGSIQNLQQDLQKMQLIDKALKNVIMNLETEPKFTSSNDKLDTVLRARAGYSRESDPKINEMHLKAEKETLSSKEFPLQTVEHVSEFATKIVDLTDEAFEINVEAGSMPLPTMNQIPLHLSMGQAWLAPKQLGTLL